MERSVADNKFHQQTNRSQKRQVMMMNPSCIISCVGNALIKRSQPGQSSGCQQGGKVSPAHTGLAGWSSGISEVHGTQPFTSPRSLQTWLVPSDFMSKWCRLNNPQWNCKALKSFLQTKQVLVGHFCANFTGLRLILDKSHPGKISPCICRTLAQKSQCQTSRDRSQTPWDVFRGDSSTWEHNPGQFQSLFLLHVATFRVFSVKSHELSLFLTHPSSQPQHPIIPNSLLPFSLWETQPRWGSSVLPK